MDEGTPRKRRLFVGVALEQSVRAGCAHACETLRKTGFAARYEAAEKLHLTLAFLGFVESSRSDAVAAALAESAAASKPFSVVLDKLGAFPNERRPRVVYIGARDQGAPFRLLAAAVRSRFAALCFGFDEDAVAHVTIARVKESKSPLPLIEFSPITLPIGALTLFESLPDRANKTSRYEIAATAPL